MNPALPGPVKGANKVTDLEKRALSAVDQDYIVSIRRELHRHPELTYDLPVTLALVRRELTEMGIPFTEKYGKSAIVGRIGREKGFTIGLRADMDALPLDEWNDVPYKSQIPGRMHACGHDAHTAMLLGAARALKAVEDELACRVLLVFQPNEEGEGSGARLMAEDGLMDEIDLIFGQHVESLLESGDMGVCPGPAMAADRIVTLEFFGKTAHATVPASGRDALAMAVTAYNEIQLMLTREINPMDRYICSVCRMNAGHAHNVIPDYAMMVLTLRYFEERIGAFMDKRIREIAESAAALRGGSAKVTSELKAPAVINDPALSEIVSRAEAKVVGEGHVKPMPVKMGSEDFAFFLAQKPGVFFRLGTKNTARGWTAAAHNNDFMPDEEAFQSGSKVFVQLVLDCMNGAALKSAQGLRD